MIVIRRSERPKDAGRADRSKPQTEVELVLLCQKEPFRYKKVQITRQ